MAVKRPRFHPLPAARERGSARPARRPGELGSLREQIGRSSRNSSKPPSSDGSGFKPPTRRKGSGRKRGGQPGHLGSGPELLPIERVDEVVEHHPQACRRCGQLLEGVDSEPLRQLVIEIPPITPLVIEHRLHRLVCPFTMISSNPIPFKAAGSFLKPQNISSNFYGNSLYSYKVK